MQKPISMVISELREKVFDSINTSGLNPTIIRFVMKDIYIDIDSQAKAFERQEEEQYAKESSTENKESTDTCNEIRP
ncbi:hypothetical protein [Qiania dongpingensis]|uniref:Uncharacterized protein n=1 Tax=Qiania dongpingensis TaxID=2763669 RepID=A0A7G9G5K4_9FIRM|nr:hypothetical protein [Qiania dongpingensis]QNM06086.1 hypothetical protein H9Q78_02675 [Qiania dongpingensis]